MCRGLKMPRRSGYFNADHAISIELSRSCSCQIPLYDTPHSSRLSHSPEFAFNPANNPITILFSYSNATTLPFPRTFSLSLSTQMPNALYHPSTIQRPRPLPHPLTYRLLSSRLPLLPKPTNRLSYYPHQQTPLPVLLFYLRAYGARCEEFARRTGGDTSETCTGGGEGESGRAGVLREGEGGY